MAAIAIAAMLIVSPPTQQQHCNNAATNDDKIDSNSKISCPNQVRKNLEFNHPIHTHEKNFTSNGIRPPNPQKREKNTKTKQNQNAHKPIYSLCLEGRLKEALDLLNAIDEVGVIVESDIYAHLLQACANLKSLGVGRQIHSLIVRNGIYPNAFLGTRLVNMYVKCGSLADARLAFDVMPERNVFSWNTIIGVCARDGLYEAAIELYYQMLDLGFEPDNFTFPSVLKACAGLAALEQGREIHHHIEKCGFESDVFVGNGLVDMYAKCGCIEEARQVFDKMPRRDLVSWNAMIAGYVQSGGHGERGLKFFREMISVGVKPNSVTIMSMFPTCSDLVTLQQGKEIHCYVMRMGFESKVAIQNALVGMYMRFGSIENAHRVFDRISQKNVVSWTTIIAGYVEDGQSDMALKLFRHMQVTGIILDCVAISTVLPVCARLAALRHGKEIHGYSIRSGLGFNAFVESALIYMYAKCGSTENARLVFDRISQGDIATWNAMIAGYGMHGHGGDAIALIDKMQEAGLNPNHITLTALLSACSHAGLVDEGWKFFDCMIRDHHQIRPTPEHYAYMVDLLGRAGRLDEAHEFIKNMPIEPNASVWGALLGACRVHCKVNLGECVANRLFELEPGNAGNYVLMSNIYSAAGRLDDVAKVRETMKSRGLQNTPGCSWIEIEKKVHTFLAGDRSHPESEKIYAMLKSLSVKMQELVYVPDTNFVSCNVEEEKGNVLCGHTEKLAVAFGLIKTSPGTAIRITKNLHMCGDCHNAIKLISKIVGQSIIVRDVNRFHHFKDGLCSCGDYW